MTQTREVVPRTRGKLLVHPFITFKIPLKVSNRLMTSQGVVWTRNLRGGETNTFDPDQPSAAVSEDPEAAAGGPPPDPMDVDDPNE